MVHQSYHLKQFEEATAPGLCRKIAWLNHNALVWLTIEHNGMERHMQVNVQGGKVFFSFNHHNHGLFKDRSLCNGPSKARGQHASWVGGMKNMCEGGKVDLLIFVKCLSLGLSVHEANVWNNIQLKQR
jgi:hypothetical protein